MNSHILLLWDDIIYVNNCVQLCKKNSISHTSGGVFLGFGFHVRAKKQSFSSGAIHFSYMSTIDIFFRWNLQMQMLNIKYIFFVFKKAFQGFTFLICRWLCKYFQLNISTRFQTNMTSTWSVQSIDIEVSSVIYVRMCCSEYVFYKKQKINIE